MKKRLEIVAQPACCAPGAPLLTPARARDVAARMKALADPTRVMIVNQLAGAGELCVCDLVEGSGVSQPTVSHHLKLLRIAGLVTSERRGTWAYYRLVPEAVAELAAALSPPPPDWPAGVAVAAGRRLD